MASYDYSISIDGVHAAGGFGSDLTHREAIDFAHRVEGRAGTWIIITRSKRGTVGRTGLYHPWVQHRAYVVTDTGSVRRTDR